MVIPVKGHRNKRVAVLAILCGMVVAVATASAQVTAPNTVTAQGGIFLLNGQPFFPILGQAWGCPVGQDFDVVKSMASIGVNVLQGWQAWCGSDSSGLDQALGESGMMWLEQGTNGGPVALQPLSELVDWQAPLTSLQDLSYINCSTVSTLGLYNKTLALAKKGPVIGLVQVGTSDGPGVCLTNQKILNVLYIQLVAGVTGVSWSTKDLRNSTVNEGFNVTPDTVTFVSGLSQKLKTLTPMLLKGSRASVVVPMNQPVRARAWMYNGVMTTIAVNTSGKPAKATISIPSLGKARGTITVNLPALGSAVIKKH